MTCFELFRRRDEIDAEPVAGGLPVVPPGAGDMGHEQRPAAAGQIAELRKLRDHDRRVDQADSLVQTERPGTERATQRADVPFR